MLTHDENRILTEVGPGKPMGALLREYWIPALLSTELPVPDCPPVRVMLLGERLIGFRDSSGQAGLIAEACPHRRASLFFASVGNGGLRCSYHGWKFDLAGRCLEVPTEPRYSSLKERIQADVYPCLERGGIVWTYMGPRQVPPSLPELEPNIDPAPRPGAALVENNWLQSVEGDIDLAHIPHLHGDNLGRFRDLYFKPSAEMLRATVGQAPRLGADSSRSPLPIEVADTAAGFAYARSRGLFANRETWEIGHYLFPFYSNLPYGELGPHWVVARVPMDDTHTMTYSMWGKGTPQPSRDLMLGEEPSYLPNTTGWFGRFRPARNPDNDFGLVRTGGESLRSSVDGQGTQDSAITWSMGSIVDRTQERLGSADVAIIHLRRRLLKAIRTFDQYGAPGVDTPEAYRVCHGAMQVDGGRSWQTELARRGGASLNVVERGD